MSFCFDAAVPDSALAKFDTLEKFEDIYVIGGEKICLKSELVKKYLVPLKGLRDEKLWTALTVGSIGIYQLDANCNSKLVRFNVFDDSWMSKIQSCCTRNG